MSVIRISGQWVAGTNVGEKSTLCEVRGGLIYGIRADGARVFGSPRDFVADTGETGEAVLAALLPKPKASTLLRGAVRESLAAAYSVATLGRQETRAWDQYYKYIIDDGEGSCGIVNFDPNGAVGALDNHEFTRNFDADNAVDLAPIGQQATLRSIVELPMFRHDERCSMTSVFWTEDGFLCGPEAWHKIYVFGGELLRRELMEDIEWQIEANEYYDLGETLANHIIQIMDRFVPLKSISLTREELTALLPEDAPFRSEAWKQLFDRGVILPA
jgi:hypothetical protein